MIWFVGGDSYPKKSSRAGRRDEGAVRPQQPDQEKSPPGRREGRPRPRRAQTSVFLGVPRRLVQLPPCTVARQFPAGRSARDLPIVLGGGGWTRQGPLSARTRGGERGGPRSERGGGAGPADAIASARAGGGGGGLVRTVALSSPPSARPRLPRPSRRPPPGPSRRRARPGRAEPSGDEEAVAAARRDDALGLKRHQHRRGGRAQRRAAGWLSRPARRAAGSRGRRRRATRGRRSARRLRARPGALRTR